MCMTYWISRSMLGSGHTNVNKVKLLSRVQLFATPWTVTYQAPPSMGFLQASILEWVAISFSRRSFQPRDWTRVSRIIGRCFSIWATREVPNVNKLWPNKRSLFTARETYRNTATIMNVQIIIREAWKRSWEHRRGMSHSFPEYLCGFL